MSLGFEGRRKWFALAFGAFVGWLLGGVTVAIGELAWMVTGLFLMFLSIVAGIFMLWEMMT